MTSTTREFQRFAAWCPHSTTLCPSSCGVPGQLCPEGGVPTGSQQGSDNSMAVGRWDYGMLLMEG